MSVGAAALPNTPHALYRFFDRTDALLYVGITMDLPARLHAHQRTKAWWTEVALMTTELFDTREAVLAAERRAIEREHPLYNDQHNTFVQATPSASRKDRDIPLELLCCDFCLSEPQVAEALRAAAKHLAEPPYEDEEADDRSPAHYAVSGMIFELIDKVFRYEFVMRHLLAEMPAAVVAEARSRTRHDFECAGEPDASEDERLPHIVRHVGDLLAECLRHQAETGVAAG